MVNYYCNVYNDRATANINFETKIYLFQEHPQDYKSLCDTLIAGVRNTIQLLNKVAKNYEKCLILNMKIIFDYTGDCGFDAVAFKSVCEGIVLYVSSLRSFKDDVVLIEQTLSFIMASQQGTMIVYRPDAEVDYTIVHVGDEPPNVSLEWHTMVSIKNVLMSNGLMREIDEY